MRTPAGWGWTSGDTSDIAEDPDTAKTAAERHAVPAGTMTVEFLLRADPPAPGPICRTGSGYRGRAGADGTVNWEAVSDIAADVAQKPSCADLGINPDALEWKRSGAREDVIEVAFPEVRYCPAGYWVLLRAGGREPLLLDRSKWNAFCGGAANSEPGIDPVALAVAS